MKALFVLDMLHDGGAQTQALNLAHELSRHSIHTSATALYSPQGLSSHLGISTSGLGVSTNAFHFPLACVRLLNLCRSNRPDIVHSHAEAADLACRFVCLTLGIPHLATAHSEFPWHWRRRLGVTLERHSSFLTRRYFAVSAAVASMLENELLIPPDRIRMIPNWAPLSPQPASPQPLPPTGRPTLLNVARLHSQKGQDVLLDAFRIVRKQLPDAALWIAGTGPEEQHLRSLASNGVHFLGHRTDVPELLRAADLFVLSSRWEGMPLSILEAMRAGLPIVSTAVAGISDLIHHGKSGTIVPIGNPLALANAIIASSTHKEQSRAMAQSARRTADRLRTQSVSAYLQSYQEILGLPPSTVSPP